MPTAGESICCREIQERAREEKRREKSYMFEELDLDSSVVCIMPHPGFSSVCLDGLPWVLETASNSVRQSYGSGHVASQVGA